MMLGDMVNPPGQQLHIEDISSPLSAQIYELCNDPEFFSPEQLQHSEVTSKCCYEENSSSFTTNLPFPPDPDINTQLNPNIDKNVTSSTTTTASNSTATATSTAATAAPTNNLSVIFDSPEDQNDISASIDFSPQTPFSIPPFLTNQVQDQFGLSNSLQSQAAPLAENNIVNGLVLPQYNPPEPVVVPFMGPPPLNPVFEEECLSLIPSYMRLNTSSSSCSFMEPNSATGPYLSADNSGIFSANLYMGNELQSQELDYQGDSGEIFRPEPLPRLYNPTEMKAPSNESQQGLSRGGSSTPLASDISSLQDSTLKVGKLSVEERKEKIHRYMKKRNERNFSKKIKYACRKTLADSRPRVRGRFAKNDELSESHRAIFGNHEDDADESLQVVVKEEEEMVDSSDIFAHISGVNSFKCNYSIQSWI